MKTPNGFHATARINRHSLTIIALILTLLASAVAFAQNADLASRVESRLSGTSVKETAKVSDKEAQALFVNQKGNRVANGISPAPDVVSATTYPFTSATGVALEDMSSGTTQLVAASQDDTASAVTNIGFEFWFDGVRFTQFSANANGLFGLGAVAVNNGASGRTNDFATSTNNPKMSVYWDDLCTSATGKVHFKVTGSPGSRKLIVEWLNAVQFNNTTVACGTTILGTFQVWIYESTGVVELVNGGVGVNDNGNAGYSAGIGSSLTSFASITTSGPTVSYAASANTQVNAVAAGAKYTFTPNVPLAPTGLNFTAVTPTSMTLNWTDNATNEVGYVVYQSTDGTNYTLVTQTAANATSQPISGLNPTTNYFFRVFAVTEGALSTVLSGSQMTAAPGAIASTAAGGNWSAPATWVGGVVPTGGDNVTIADGATVTIDTAALALNLTLGSGGTAALLQFEPTTARTLTVGQSVTVASNGTFQSATTGTVTTHVLSVGTDLTNNGVLDFSTNTNTAGANITFTGAANNTFSGTGATTDIRTMTINKGTSSANTIELNTTNFTVQGVNTDGTPAAFLTLTNGTLKVSGTFTANFRTFTAAAYTIPATGGFWLNNPNYTVPGQNGSPTNNGLLRVSQGTFNIGSASGNAMGAGAGAAFTIEGGIVNIAGRLLTASAVTYTQSGGTVNVCTVGNASSVTQSFGLTSATTSFNMSGGTINLVQINSTATAANRRDYSVAGTANITGGTLNVGTAATTGNAGNFDFRIQGLVPNLVLDNTTNNKNVIVVGQMNTLGNVTIPTGSTLNTQSFVWLVIGTTVTNNGTITIPTNLSRFYFLGNGPQTYTGNGTCTIVTASGSVDLTMDNPAGLTIDPSSTGIVTQRVNFFRGGITNANKLTLGNGGVTVGVIQYGLAGGLNTAGNFDVAPTFNIGSGGQTILYAQEPTTRTTSVEVNPTRILNNMTVNNTNGVNLSGDLSITFLSTSLLTLTAGNFNIGANTLTLTNSPATTPTNLKGGPTSSLVLNGTTAINVPSSITALNNFTLNNAGGSTLQGQLAVGGTLSLQNGVLSIGANELSINGPLTVGTGSLTGGATSNISVLGAGASLTLPAVSGGLGRLSVGRASGVTLGAPLNVGIALELFAGTLSNTTNNVTLANGAIITVGTGSLTSAPIFGTTVNVIYLGSLPATTGLEIPVLPTVLNNMTVDNVGGITLGSSPLVNGQLNLTNGVVTTGANILSVGAGGTTPRTNGFVFGNLRKFFAGAGSKTFEVGAGSYVPVVANITSVAGGSDSLTVAAVNGALTNAPDGGTSLNKSWTISSSGVRKGTLTFNYNAIDVNGNVALFRIFRKNTTDQRFFQTDGAADNVNEGAFTATTIGTVAFSPISKWTLAEASSLHVIAGQPRPYENFDFDANDAKSEVAIWNGTSGNWTLRNSATGGTRVQLDWGKSALGDKIVPGDYDGDARTDVAVFRPSEGNWYIVRSSNSTILLQNWGQTGDKPVVGDFNGDGKTDYAVFRVSEGNWYVLNNGGTSSVTGWGTTGDQTAPADYDGDGKTDIAVFRPSEGNWYVRNSSGGSSVTNWGISGDVLVPGDYDGDGRADIAVWRASESNWYIRNSSDGSVTVRNWGNSSDVPIPGDYDRDGRVDVAVYRPSDSNFYIFRSSDGNTLSNLFSGAGDVPVASAPNIP